MASSALEPEPACTRYVWHPMLDLLDLSQANQLKPGVCAVPNSWTMLSRWPPRCCRCTSACLSSLLRCPSSIWWESQTSAQVSNPAVSFQQCMASHKTSAAGAIEVLQCLAIGARQHFSASLVLLRGEHP